MKKSIKKILKEYTEESNITFKDVYDEMWNKMLYGVCMKYTNDINQAQDYCQNGFMKVYKNFNLFTGGWIIRRVGS